MHAKRPETRAGSGNVAPRRVVFALAAGWLLGGAACLILQSIPSVSRAEAAAGSKPAGAPASKPGVSESPRSASDSTVVAPGAGDAGDGTSASSTDTAVPPGKTKAASGASTNVTPEPSAAVPGAKSPARAAKPATVPPVRSGRSSDPLASARPAAGTTPSRLRSSGTSRARGVQAVAHLDQKLTYQYNALGRRDPFQPMIGGEFVGADVGGDAPVDVGGMKVVGIVWGTEDKFAMAEDGRGQSLVLRVGDKVMNGVVEGLRREAVVVRITSDGQTQSVTIPLTRKGDKSNATR